MFDVGMLEIIVILVLALIVLGPERLPQAARTVGYWFGKMRRYVEGMKAEVEKEFDTSELKRMLHNQEVQLKELQNKLNQSTDVLEQTDSNLFDDDDPGNGHRPNSNYDIIEQDDEEYDLLEVTPKQAKHDETNDLEADKKDQLDDVVDSLPKESVAEAEKSK
jgi:sec-independent protein translocase protein TatB